MSWLAVALVLMLGDSPAVPKAETAPVGSDLTWRLSGPGGGGWLQSIAWDPHHADTLYVGCDVGGFYFSADAGRQYELRNQGLHDYFLEVVAVHPADSRIILLGTESGIHRTIDQGKTWQWIREGFPPIQGHAFSAPIGAIAFDPLEPNVVYAGVGRPRWDKSGAGAVYRSDDTGLTWRLISSGQLPADAIVRDLEFKPGQSQTLLAATQRGVFRSDDEGKTWTASSEGLPQSNVEELAFAPSAPNVVYASLRTTARDKQPFDGGVCRSDDAGRTWRVVNGPGMPSRVGASHQPLQMTSNLKELVVDPRNADVVYLGDRAWVTAGVYKTEDGGKHWKRVTVARDDGKNRKNMDYGWLTQWGPSVECLALSPAKPDRLVFGTSGQVFVTDDGGRTWQQRYCKQLPDDRVTGTGLEVTCLFQVIPDPVRPERLWYCYMDLGLLVSDDHGTSFRRSFQGMKHTGNTFTVAVDPQKPSTVWAGTGQWGRNTGDVCRSTDGGQSWQVVGKPDTGLPDGQTKHLVLDRTSPTERRRLVVSCQDHGLYESRDGGQSWQCINGDLPASVKQLRGLWLDPADANHLVVALGGSPDQGAGVYASGDAGRSWQRLNREPQFAGITSLVVDPKKTSTLYLTTREHFDHQTRRLYPGGLFVSTDGGHQWRRILDFRFVQAMAISPADSRVVYAVTTDHAYHDNCRAQGLLKSRDGGATWQRENTGLSHHNFSCLSISPHDPTAIYVGTSGNSVFIGKDRGVSRGTR
jgi:photosystem II stability/assembly factor-like uncharacterized protein